MRRSTLLTALLVTLACSHSEPFPPLDFGTDQPFDPGPPPRLTANLGDDGAISFTPDGANLVYSLNKQCIAFLPAHQARASRWLCAPPIEFETNSYSHPAISARGRLAFVLGPLLNRTMVVAPLSDIRDTSEIVPVPFVTTADGIVHTDVTRLAWLRGDTLAILADSIVYLTDPASTARPRVFVPLPLPASAYSIQAGQGGSVLYLRVTGDARVLVWDLSTGGLSTLYDFGADSAGQVAVGTRHLAAVTPGAVVRINLQDNSTINMPTYNLVIAELAMTPDGSDIIVSAMTSPGLPTTDLFRLKP